MSGRALYLFLLLVIPVTARPQPDTVRRGAAITLKVENYSDSARMLAQVVEKHKGVLADRQQVSNNGGHHSGWTRVIVPKAELDGLLIDLRSMGRVYGERLTLTNLGSLYEDLGKRAQRLKEHQQRLANILTSRRSLRGSDLLFVQERLYRASTDEDSLMEERDSIPSKAASSSVIVQMFEPTPIKEEPRGVAGHVKAAVTGAFRSLAFTALGLIGPLLNLLVLLLILVIAWRILRRPLKNAYAKLRAAFDESDSATPQGAQGSATPASPPDSGN